MEPSVKDQINEQLSRIEKDKVDIYNAIEAKGGVIAEDSLDNYAEAILNLPDGAETEIDFEKHPDAYMGISGLTQAGAFTIVYIEDEETITEILTTAYKLSSLGLVPVAVAFGPKVAELSLTKIGDNFLASQDMLSVTGLEHFTQITELGDNFLANGNNSNLDLQSIGALPPNLTKVGSNFMNRRQVFNAPVIFPDTITEIGDYCLNSAHAFNSELHLPEQLTTLGDYSFSELRAFNQPLNLPSGLTVIPNSFLYNATAFNQPVVFPAGATEIRGQVLAKGWSGTTDAPVFNSPITFPTENPCTIGQQFLYDQSTYNQPITIPANITTIGDYFLYDNDNFVGPLTVESASTTWQGSRSFSAAAVGAYNRIYGILVEGDGAEATAQYFNGQNNAYFVLNRDTTVYGGYATIQSGTFNYYRFTTPEDVEKVANSTYSWTGNVRAVRFLEPVQELPITTFVSFLQTQSDINVYGMENFVQATSTGDNYLIRHNAFSSDMVLFPPNITEIGNSCLANAQWSGYGDQVVIPSQVQSIGNDFAANSSRMKALTLPSSLRTIGDNFCDNAFTSYSLDKPLELPEGVESIGDNFLRGATTLYVGVTIPSTVNSIGTAFLAEANYFRGPLTVNTDTAPTDSESLAVTVQSATAYTEGITLAGSGAEAWKTALPDSDTSPYRKLVIAE